MSVGSVVVLTSRVGDVTRSGLAGDCAGLQRTPANRLRRRSNFLEGYKMFILYFVALDLLLQMRQVDRRDVIVTQLCLRSVKELTPFVK